MRVLITGANRGIGLELARQAAARGDQVHATARDPSGEIANIAFRVHRVDVGKAESVAALAAELAGAPLDVVINNAGIYGRHDGLDQLDLEDALQTYQVNALGALRVSIALLPNLRAGDGKKLMHITSRMGSITDNTSGGSYGYRMSKAALNMASRSLAIDLRNEGIISAVINPGWVRTDMGGGGAPTTVDVCATGIWQTIERLGAADSGQFLDFMGRPNIPW